MSKVNWYLFKADHGPGHQSHHEEYIWYTYDMSDDDLEWELESLCQRFNNVRATMEPVDKPPLEAADHIVKMLKGKIELYHTVINDLTPLLNIPDADAGAKERAWKTTHNTLIKMLDDANEEAYRWKNSYHSARVNWRMMSKMSIEYGRQAYTELEADRQAYISRLENWIHEAHTDIEQWVSFACWQRREIEDPDHVHCCPTQRGIDKSKKIWSNYPIRRDRK